MIEILSTSEHETLYGGAYRHANIAITNAGDTRLWGVGGLPLAGDLQAILDAREAELWAAASVGGAAFDVFDVREREILKALALVVMDEINILRTEQGLALRNEGQIRAAIKGKLG